MAWSLVSTGAFSSDDDARSASVPLSLALPGTISSGNLLLAFIACRPSTGYTWSHSGSYTKLGSAGTEVEVWGKIAGSSESAPTFANNTSGATCGILTCWDGNPSSLTGIVDGSVATADNTGTAVVDIPTPSLATPSVDNCLILYVGGGSELCFDVPGNVTPPNSSTKIVTQSFDGQFNDVSLGVSYTVQTTKASIGASTFNTTNAGTMRSRSLVMALVAGVTTTKKLKLLVQSSAASASSIAGVVFSAPSGTDITGTTRYGEFTGKTFESALESGKAVLKVPVADFGGSALTTASTPVALVRNADNTTGIIAGTVIEE